MPSATSATIDPLARLRSLPKAGPPNDDVSQVRGNCSDEHKQLNMNAWAYYAPSGTAVFGGEQARQLKLVEANIRKRRIGPPNSSDPEGCEAETIYEIEVKEGMLSANGTMAGACIMHLFDVCTFSVLFQLGAAVNRDVGGLSLAMDIKYHASALRGTVLSIVATSMTIKGRILFSRAEMYDKKTGKLIASGVHAITPMASNKGDAALRATPKL